MSFCTVGVIIFLAQVQGALQGRDIRAAHFQATARGSCRSNRRGARGCGCRTAAAIHIELNIIEVDPLIGGRDRIKANGALAVGDADIREGDLRPGAGGRDVVILLGSAAIFGFHAGGGLSASRFHPGTQSIRAIRQPGLGLIGVDRIGG